MNSENRPALMYKALLITFVALVAAGVVAVVAGQSHSTTTVRTVQVEITKDGFSPSAVSVSAGTQIQWVNRDTTAHRLAANPHPSHSDLPGLVSKDIAPGAVYSFTMKKTGTFGYHDEANPLVHGQVTVK